MPHIPLERENNVRTGFVEQVDYDKLVEQTKDLWMRVVLELGYTYGWRKGELLGLQVRNVDLLNRTIRLDVGTTKNKEGREVAMTAAVRTLLQAACAGKKPADYVLTRDNGGRVRNFRKAWALLCTRAGLGQLLCRACGQPTKGRKCPACGCPTHRYRGLMVHDLRRSAAKAARAAGIPESVVMSMGGWKTAAMFRRYAIVSSADHVQAVQKLEAARTSQSDAKVAQIEAENRLATMPVRSPKPA